MSRTVNVRDGLGNEVISLPLSLGSEAYLRCLSCCKYGLIVERYNGQDRTFGVQMEPKSGERHTSGTGEPASSALKRFRAGTAASDVVMQGRRTP